MGSMQAGTQNDENQVASFLIQNGAEIRDLLQLTDTETEALYQEAYDYYQQESYEEALSCFSLLVQVAHLDKRFHYGYAATLQHMKRYAEAIQAYMLASTFDLSDPEPTLLIGYCLMQLQRYEDAKRTFELVIEETAMCDHYQSLYIQTRQWQDELGRLEFSQKPSQGA